jgi:hypothetical protein
MEKNVNTYGDLFFDVAETFIKVGEPAKAALVSSIINLPLPTHHDILLRWRSPHLRLSIPIVQVFEKLVKNSAYNIPSIWQMQAESYRNSGNSTSAINTFLHGIFIHT